MKIKKIQLVELEKFQEDILNLLKQNYYINLNIEDETILNGIVKEKYKELKEYAKQDKAILYGSIDEKHLNGFAWAYEQHTGNDVCVHLNHLIIHQNNRRNGLGTLLLEAIENEARTRGIYCMNLVASLDNKNAIGFYKKNFFTEKRIILEKNL